MYDVVDKNTLITQVLLNITMLGEVYSLANKVIS